MPRANPCKQGLEIFFLVSQLRIPTPCLCLCHYSLQIRELLCHSSALSISHRHPGRPTVTNIWQNAHSNSFYTHMCSSHMYSLSTHSSKQQCPSDPCQPGRSISEHKACLGTHEMALFTFPQRISRVYQSSNWKPVDVLPCDQKVISFEAVWVGVISLRV